jgi:hypothetical protein
MNLNILLRLEILTLMDILILLLRGFILMLHKLNSHLILCFNLGLFRKILIIVIIITLIVTLILTLILTLTLILIIILIKILMIISIIIFIIVIILIILTIMIMIILLFSIYLVINSKFNN